MPIYHLFRWKQLLKSSDLVVELMKNIWNCCNANTSVTDICTAFTNTLFLSLSLYIHISLSRSLSHSIYLSINLSPLSLSVCLSQYVSPYACPSLFVSLSLSLSYSLSLPLTLPLNSENNLPTAIMDFVTPPHFPSSPPKEVSIISQQVVTET